MTTFQFAVALNDSEYIALENLLAFAIKFQEADSLERLNIKMECVGVNQCKEIQKKLIDSIRGAVMTSTSSFCK